MLPNCALTYLDLSSYPAYVAAIKISSKVEEKAWLDLKALARESHQSISGVLSEAIQEYLRRRRIRPVVLEHFEDSITENRELGSLLAR